MSVVVQFGSRGALHLGFEQVTVDTTVGGVKLNVAKFSQQFSGGVHGPGASGALITVDNQPIRAMFDEGTTVTSTVGHLLQPGSTLAVDGTENLRNLRFIQDTSATGSAKINVTYWS
jgi:hypothetical protein